MIENTLNKIIEKKRIKINKLKNSVSLNDLIENIKNKKNFLNFKEKIIKNNASDKFSLIAEIKKASPSSGIIIENYDPVEIAILYNKNKATCLSVLTEEEFFLGNFLHISKIKEKVNLPILCKDFFIDPFQVKLAKSYGADAILIIISALSDNMADKIYNEALKSNMSIIVEIHTSEEALKALRFKDAIIGINNRNLKTLETNINTTFDMYEILEKHEGPLVSESGIKSKEDILKISKKTKIKTFLIGESLLKNLDKNSIFSLL